MTVDEKGSRISSRRLLIVGEPARLQSRGGVWNEYPASSAWHLIKDGTTCLYGVKGETRFWDTPHSLDIDVPEAATAELEKQ